MRRTWMLMVRQSLLKVFITIFLVSIILMALLALYLISGMFILFSAMFNVYATLLMTSKCLFRKRVAFGDFCF